MNHRCAPVTQKACCDFEGAEEVISAQKNTRAFRTGYASVCLILIHKEE
jgi:hypothetical protein